MFKLNKKGLSDIISTVLIILLILVSVSLISMSVFKLVKNPALSPGESCPIIQFNKVVKIYKVCLNQETKDIEITLERNLDENYLIEELAFVVDKNEKTNKYKCGDQCGECKILNPGNIKTYYITTQENPDKLSLILNNCVLETKEINNC